MFRVQPGSGEPIYLQLIRAVKHAIVAGTLAPGEQLPTVRELAATMTINPNTVARAYRELERDGIIETARGRGTFVRVDAPPIGRAEQRRRLRPAIERLVADARAIGVDDAALLEDVERVLRAPASRWSVSTS